MKTQFKIWLEKVDQERKDYWDKTFTHKSYEPLKVKKGNKFMKLIDGTSVWGFVSMFEGEHKGVPIKKGDLLKAATWKAPAKHARGNIIDDTARYGVYGPEYL